MWQIYQQNNFYVHLQRPQLFVFRCRDIVLDAHIITGKKGKAIPVTGHGAHRVVRRRGFPIF
jgi:hypothetical protein